nr:MAG: hypothetical protein [Bacteriophage sp.]
MQFLDAIGLAYFWEKIKDWANSRFFSQRGGEIMPEIGLHYTINGEHLGITIDGNENETINIFDVDENGMEAIAIVKTGGTATQVLMADGSVRTLNAANGICGLDANGRIPLAQLGNLDTSLFKLVTSLPSSGESNKIYIVKDGSDANDVYQEYYYTNGAWEKIGTHTVKVDLTPYAKKTEAVINMDFRGVASDGSSTSNTSIRNLVYTLGDGRVKVADVPLAEPRSTGGRPYAGQNGFMRASDKAKLDGIADGANNYTLPTASASVLGGILIGYGTSGRNYAVLLDGSGKAYVNVPWTDTNTTYDLSPYAKKMETVDFSSIRLYKQAIANTPQGLIEKQVILFSTLGDNVKSGEIVLEEATSNMSGLMSIRDKNKLDYIANNATADSAITTAEIDALFA